MQPSQYRYKVLTTFSAHKSKHFDSSTNLRWIYSLCCRWSHRLGRQILCWWPLPQVSSKTGQVPPDVVPEGKKRPWHKLHSNSNSTNAKAGFPNLFPSKVFLLCSLRQGKTYLTCLLVGKRCSSPSTIQNTPPNTNSTQIPAIIHILDMWSSSIPFLYTCHWWLIHLDSCPCTSIQIQESFPEVWNWMIPSGNGIDIHLPIHHHRIRRRISLQL